MTKANIANGVIKEEQWAIKSKLVVNSKKAKMESKVVSNKIPRKVIPAIIKCSLKFNLLFLKSKNPFKANKGTKQKSNIFLLSVTK